ncbi:MAG: class I adenylate cyclase [Pseudomonadota bacterium]
MMHLQDGSEEFSEGIDRRQLTLVKQRFLELNQERYARTLAGFSDRQQQFLTLLPLLFHVSHPMLPGYGGHQTPAGIHGYVPSKNDIRTAKVLARSFTYQHDLIDKKNALDALFLMGSLGTIAHSEISDIDVWVCYKNETDSTALAALQNKCNSLSLWAADVIHIETHFFLMNSQEFCQGQQTGLTNEASGSAQHFLLLDEFYRTAVWLAGKLPLWWFVPAEQEHQYTDYTANLLGKRFLRSSDVIDFGGVPAIPRNEYIGAGVWQLYKGIDSPYKSVLKLLLLEAYANDEFNEPLALDLKRKIYAATTKIKDQANDLDAYVLIYQRLEKYLQAKNQMARLELVRRCFYFKAGKSLSKTSRASAKSWQRLLLEEMVKAWGWQNSLLTMLDNRAYWKSPHVLIERNLLAHELDHAYRLLMDMNKSNSGNAAISGNELLILGRKLHAAFERKAGKIDWINPNISQDLSEPALCFVQVIESGLPIWQVYRGSQQDLALRNKTAEPIKRSRNFIESLLWCYANGILSVGVQTANTRLDILSKDFVLQNSQSQQLLVSMQNWLPVPLVKPEHDCFTKSAQPNCIMLLFNIGVEPQAELHKKGMQMLSNQRDAFGYSGLKENLVLSVDIIQSNTWGEIVCRHFATDALVNCLLYYLRLVPPFKYSALPELTIRCLSLGQGSIIEQRVMELWRAIIGCFYSGTRPRNTRFLFQVADEYLLLQFIQQQPQIFRFKTYDKLVERLSQPQTEFSPIVVDAFALSDKPLRLFLAAAKVPGIYVFYEIDGAFAEVSIVDHKGSLFTRTFKLHNTQTLLRPLCRFIRSTVERQILENEVFSDASNNANLLQDISIYELMDDEKQKPMRLELRTIGQDISQLQFINICAVAEPADNYLTNNPLSYTIFCDGKEFSELEYGAEIFSAVAGYILTCRQHGETYPCYITDLDLSLCRDAIAPQTGVQLIHYLHIKSELEQKLTQALQNL